MHACPNCRPNGINLAKYSLPDAKEKQFMGHLASNKGKESAMPLRAQAGPGPFSLLEGTSILVGVRSGAVSSDKAGPCRVQVEEDVYDTVTQRIKLIPAGTSILCTYNAEVAHGQETMLLAFTKMIFPSGANVMLGGMPASDPQGAIGVTFIDLSGVLSCRFLPCNYFDEGQMPSKAPAPDI